LGHPVVIEQKFMPGTTDFTHQLRVIQDSRVDGIVLWADIGPTAMILKQMQALGMNQKVFGSHRTIGDELLKIAGPAAEGFEAVYPYDPNREDTSWREFNASYQASFQEKPDHFAALAYDAMQALLKAICRAGLNKARIRDALTGLTTYEGVTGKMIFDPNCKNIAPLFLARVHDGAINYRRITMDKPYAQVGENGVSYEGPALPDEQGSPLKIGIFGPSADEIVASPEIASLLQKNSRAVSLVPIASQLSWGKASDKLVNAVYEDQVIALVALDRASSHLAEQIAVKSFVPVIAISSDHALTTTNIPWIFRLPENIPVAQALSCLMEALERAGPNREKLRDVLSSGTAMAGINFDKTGEPKF
jgi:phosphoribosylcarboxyaminoimidazole (NCAIR) mutase